MTGANWFSRDHFDSIPDAIIFYNDSGIVTDLNAQAARLYEVGRGESIIGEPIGQLIQGLSVLEVAAGPVGTAEPPAVQRLVAVPRRGARFAVDVTVNRAGGSTEPVHAAVLRAVNGGSTAAPRTEDVDLRKVVDTVAIGLALIRGEAIAYANPAMYGILDRDSSRPLPAEAISTLLQSIQEQRPDRHSGSGERLEAQMAEIRLIRPNGDIRWVKAASGQINQDDGEADQLVVSLEDITSLKQSESLLLDSEQRFHQMASSVRVGFSLRELGGGGFSYVSPSFLRVFGMDPELISPSFAEVASRIHPDDRALAASAAALVEKGKTIREVLRIYQSAAEIRWIEFCSAPVLDAENRVVRVAATVEDVTERQEVETALRESEERFRRIASALQVGVSLRQVEPARFLWANEQYKAIAGLDPTALSQEEIDRGSRAVHPDDREVIMGQYVAKVAAGEPAQAEFRLVDEHGAIKWLRATSHPIEAVKGTVALVAGTLEDISARKNAEAAMLSARREAESANRSKSEFLSRMSHELRTPLNAILGFAQILELDLADGPHVDAVQHILGGGRHLLAMINDLLDVSRIESDELEVLLAPVKLADVVAESIILLRHEAARKRVTVNFDPGKPHADRWALVDRRRFRQVLVNLLSNAIKYNRDHGRVDITCELSQKSFVAVSLADTGIGIRSEDFPRLFNPFDRLGQQNSDVEGTGIGLTLSRRLLEVMDGRIEVASTWGAGSTFLAIVPLAAQPGPLGTGGHQAESDAPAQRPKTLVYVEDNQADVELMRRIVGRRPNWRLVHADNGATGLHAIYRLIPDLVFMDLHLSDSNGIDLVHAVRQRPATAGVPLMVVSADAGPGQLQLIHAAGALGCLIKPFDVAEVFDVLDRFGAGGYGVPAPGGPNDRAVGATLSTSVELS